MLVHPESWILPIDSTTLMLPIKLRRWEEKQLKESHKKDIIELASKVLVEIGSPVLEQINNALYDSNGHVRWEVAEVLARIDEIRGVDLLVKGITDVDESQAKWWEVPYNNVRRLARIRATRAIDQLVPLVSDSDFGLEVVRALGIICDQRTIRTYSNLPSDRETSVIWQTKRPSDEQLGKIEAVLVDALRYELLDIRFAASDALVRIGPASVDLLIDSLGTGDARFRWHIVDTLRQIKDPKSIHPLIGRLFDYDEQVRWRVSAALAEIGKSAIPLLIPLLDYPDTSIREQVANILGRIGEPEAIKGLLSALSDPDPSVRESAAQSIGKIKEPSAMSALGVALNDTSWRVRAAAVDALGNFDTLQAINLLLAALQDDDKWVRGNAVEALRKIGNETAIEPLDVLASTDAEREISISAIAAVQEIRTKMETDRTE